MEEKDRGGKAAAPLQLPCSAAAAPLQRRSPAAPLQLPCSAAAGELQRRCRIMYGRSI